MLGMGFLLHCVLLKKGWETRLMQTAEGGGPDSGGRNAGSLMNTGQPYRLPRPARHGEATRACVWGWSHARPSIRENSGLRHPITVVSVMGLVLPFWWGMAMRRFAMFLWGREGRWRRSVEAGSQPGRSC
ncbi:hypothetical protein CBM2585_B140023 [Cupriavidus taiwanensis]|nr:hypothetical protein CBM2585_B140023 [Cupriavidus taiwanensis]SPC23880.1 hypothetical protein CT19431_MP90022 [Cupriavidus taiwanensis]